MRRTNAWTSEVDWETGRWRRRSPGPPHREWQPPSPHGVLAKRPLTFFEVLDSGFRLLRFAPGATVGASLILFSLWTLVLVAIGTALVLRFFPLLADLVTNDAALSGFSLLAQVGSFALSLLSLGLVHFLAGLTAAAAQNSFTGTRTSLAESWRAVRGHRRPLILAGLLLTVGNALLLVLVVLPASLPALFDDPVLAVVLTLIALGLWTVATIWLNLRFAFTGAVIAVEGTGVRTGLVRSWRLTGRGFWRALGELALGYFLSNQLIQLIITPFLLVLTILGFGVIGSTISDERVGAALAIVIAAAVLALTAMSAALLFAYFSCLVCVAYFDLRMRSEGYDLILIRDAERLVSGRASATDASRHRATDPAESHLGDDPLTRSRSEGAR